ncbi:MAG: LamG-like jellyroll fold domain-containing protein, partial [Planctomycetota bacterium]
TATTFDCGSMSNDTTYYWRIDEINAAGTTTGNVWSFTTEAAAIGDVEIIGSWTSGTSHAEEAGSNRALIFIAHAESSVDTSDLGSVTYGGQSMTKVVERNMHSSYSAYTCAFILDEAGIDAATSGTFSPSWNTAPSGTPAFTSVFLQNVNQTTLTGATGTGGTTTTTAETPALSTSDGDMAIVAGTCGNDATYSTINGFTEAIEVVPSSADGIGGYLACTGADVTPGVSHTNVNRQSVIGFVVKASTGGPTPPGQASTPSPANSATDVSITATLSWTAGTDATSHDVYFGTSSPGAFQGNQTAVTFDPGALSYDTTYYWRIDEVNVAGTTTGNVWNFTTEAAPSPPGQASNPSPANSATDVSITADLSWTAGTGSTSSDVYFGTTSPGTFQGNQTATTFDPGTMANDTTYYWRIDEINVGGTTTGNVWNFTTIASAGDEIIGWWELNDASGTTATDSSTYGNDGTLVGSPPWTDDAERGWCLDFTGENNYVTLPNESFFDITSNVSVMGWMKASYVDWRNFSTIIAKGKDPTGWALQKAGKTNAMSFYVAASGMPWDGIKAGTNVFDGQWHHVAGVYDGSNAYIYIDGGLDSNSVGCSGSITTNDWDVYIGENSQSLDEGTSAREWEGLIDDVRIYNYALTQSEVNDIYTGGAPTPPGQASNPTPAQSATNISIDADLSWNAGTGSTSSDVYFGTDSTPDSGEFKGNQTATTYEPGTMANDTTYYWRIDEVNAGGTTTGTVWSFTTIVAAPAQAASPSPANAATNVDINANLSWSAGSGATSHDVYFGTSSPGAFQGNQAATTFEPGTMANDTTYYWRIDEVNAAGTTTGTVWNFTTIVAAPAQASNPSPANTATDVDINANLSWSAGSGATSHDVYFGTSSPGSYQGNQAATTFDPGTM